MVCRRITDRAFNDALQKNKSLYNKHKGERCFVVGNGPSLKNMDLSRLKSEYCFTVNTIFRAEEIFKSINSDFHVLVDPNFANYSEEQAEDLVANITRWNKNIILITEYWSNNIYSKYIKNNLYQVYSHRKWTKHNKIKLDSNLLLCQNVVQVAIYAAIYMGFKEIILIGCDMTSFYENFAANAGRCVSYHVYDMTEETKKRYQTSKSAHDNTYMLKDYAITFDIFKKIANYADENGIKIINATEGGILDMFARQNFQDL